MSTDIVTHQHTPGPWSILRRGDAREIVAGDEGQYDISTIWLLHDAPGHVAGNASLISAAPSMYAALKTIQKHRLESEEPLRDVTCGVCAARIGWLTANFDAPVCDDCVIATAIAKAEGRS